MQEKSWSDQPDEVTRGEILTRMNITSGIVEVRRIDYETAYFVTVGNLFGSETVKAADANAAFRLLNVLAKLKRGDSLDPRKVHGITVMPSPVR